MTTPAPPSPRPRVRLRRSPGWLLAGVVAVCLGGLASAFLYLSVAASEPVLRVNRTIHRGELITGADLSVVSLGRGLDLKAVPADRVTEVSGRSAVTDLPAGSLLVEGSYGDGGLGPGEARVGVRLAAGRFPSVDLRPGTPLLVVALPSGELGSDPGAGLPGSVQATLVAEPAVQPDGSYVVDLDVPADRAETVARLASTDRVSLVQQGSGR